MESPVQPSMKTMKVMRMLVFFLLPFTFADIFLSTIINNVRETIDTIERMTVGIKSDIVNE